MTPEQARDLYYKARQKVYIEVSLRGDRIVEDDICHAGFQAVLDAYRQELDREWAERYLALSQGKDLLDLNNEKFKCPT